MQWLIDIISELVLKSFKGMIVLWSGAVDDIPDGWALCNGSQGTPNLQNRFVRGVTPPWTSPGDTGGGDSHTHTFQGDGHGHKTYAHSHSFTGDGHVHAQPPSKILQFGNDYRPWGNAGYASGTTGDAAPDAQMENAFGTTDVGDSKPPFYVLAYIMKL